MQEHDDHELEPNLREERAEEREMPLPEALAVAICLAVLTAWVAFSGVGGVTSALRNGVVGPLMQVRDSSTAALRSALGESASKVGAVASAAGAAAGAAGAVSSALTQDIVGVLAQARDSSTGALRSAMGQPATKSFTNGGHQPFDRQYHSAVLICLTNDQAYVTRRVSAGSVPSLVSKGAVYPVPAGGCS